MFKCKVGGRQVAVYFRHLYPVKTECLIEIDVVRGEKDAIVSGWRNVGEARCMPCDNFSKWEGRRIALTKTLAPYPRWFRKKIWKAYWNRINYSKLTT